MHVNLAYFTVYIVIASVIGQNDFSLCSQNDYFHLIKIFAFENIFKLILRAIKKNWILLIIFLSFLFLSYLHDKEPISREIFNFYIEVRDFFLNFFSLFNSKKKFQIQLKKIESSHFHHIIFSSWWRSEWKQILSIKKFWEQKKLKRKQKKIFFLFIFVLIG